MIARQVGGFQISTLLVKRGGVALSEEERIAHQEGLVKEHQHSEKNVGDDFEIGQDAASEREASFGNPPRTKRHSLGRAGRRRKKRQTRNLLQRYVMYGVFPKRFFVSVAANSVTDTETVTRMLH